MKGKKKTRRKSPTRSSHKAPQGHFIIRWISIAISVVVLLLIAHVLFPKANKPDEFCANSISCIRDLTGKFEENATTGEFMGKTVALPKEIVQSSMINPVLGETTSKGEKKIYVDLAVQHLYAFEDNKLVFDFPVSTGKFGATPTGTFTIWSKLRFTRMSGGSQALGTYYNLPNVPYVMFFSNASVPRSQGFSIHGTYWHDNFGTPMSHGCVNMKTEEVEKIYNWANPPSEGSITYATDDNPGTTVTIYGIAPQD